MCFASKIDKYESMLIQDLSCLQLDSCNQEDPDETQVVDDKDSWIGVIRIPVLEYYNARGSRSCSILERVCN